MHCQCTHCSCMRKMVIIVKNGERGGDIGIKKKGKHAHTYLASEDAELSDSTDVGVEGGSVVGKSKLSSSISLMASLGNQPSAPPALPSQ